jgi:hypothetical protein
MKALLVFLMMVGIPAWSPAQVTGEVTVHQEKPDIFLGVPPESVVLEAHRSEFVDGGTA